MLKSILLYFDIDMKKVNQKRYFGKFFSKKVCIQ